MKYHDLFEISHAGREHRFDVENGLAFPGTKRGKSLSDMTLTKLVKAMDYDVHVHGFRTSFRTWAQERTNFPREVAEVALAHVNADKMEAAYALSDLFEKRRKMMGGGRYILHATLSRSMMGAAE